MIRRSLAVGALLCVAAAAPAHATEYDWTPAGQLSEARLGAASAVLGDGRVLFAGGWKLPAQQEVATVDVYDPRTQTWAPGPALPDPRRDASAVTLPDGRVLVLGGADDADQHRAEIFRPAAGTWTRVGDSIGPHVDTPGFVLADGRVLFLGGSGYWSQWPGGEFYDPATDTWKQTAAPHEVAVFGRAVVRLRDGRFLVVGSKTVVADRFAYDLPLAEIYDAARDTWTVVPPPSHAGEGAGAALLPDGRVLFAGGRPGGSAEGPLDASAQRSAEIFDPATERWSPTGDLNRPRAYASPFVTLPDGRIAAIGGSWATFTGPIGQRRVGDIFYEDTSEIYDAATGTWLPTAPMSQPRSGPVATVLGDGSVLVVGGIAGADNAATATAERLAPRPVPPPPPAAVAPLVITPKPGTLRLLAGPKRVKLAKTLVVRVRCAGGACADLLVVRGRGRTLARREVSLAAGRTLTVRVKLSAAARRALRHRTTRVTVSLRKQGTQRSLSVRG
jgi:hypothetical protein